MYNNTIKQLDACIIEQVPIEQTKEQVNDTYKVTTGKDIHYIPHHGVVCTNRQTKLHVIYDGSATTTTRKHSLNDCLLTGPNYIPNLFHMMIKFRFHNTPLDADIENNWNERERSDIVELKFCRLVFGLRTSPAILSAMI